jgi:hypothetical protein
MCFSAIADLTLTSVQFGKDLKAFTCIFLIDMETQFAYRFMQRLTRFQVTSSKACLI